MRRSYICGAVFLFILMAAFSGIIAQTPRTINNAGENILVKVENLKAAPEPYRFGFSTITGRDGRALLSYLSSDLLEGRETGSRGYRLAAGYAASLFALWGLEPAGDTGSDGGRGYLQEVVMKDYNGLGCTADGLMNEGENAGGRTFHEGVDLENYYRNRIPEIISASVIFAGYGLSEKSIAYDDFAGLELNGKIVMILDEVPGQGNPASPFMRGGFGGDLEPGRSGRRPRSLAPGRDDGEEFGYRQRLPSFCRSACSLSLLGRDDAQGLSPDERQRRQNRPGVDGQDHPPGLSQRADPSRSIEKEETAALFFFGSANLDIGTSVFMMGCDGPLAAIIQ